jgi:hypothetical protein
MLEFGPSCQVPLQVLEEESSKVQLLGRVQFCDVERRVNSMRAVLCTKELS